MEVGVQEVLTVASGALLAVVAFFLSRFAAKVDKLSESVASLSKSVAVLDTEHRGNCEALAARIDEREARSKIHWTTQRVLNKETRRHIDQLGEKVAAMVAQ